MRIIRKNGLITINVTHASNDKEGLTKVSLSIALDGNKYMEGRNLIECIDPRVFPVISEQSISQVLSEEDQARLYNLLTKGIVLTTPIPQGAKNGAAELIRNYMLGVDNASEGVINLDLGSTKIRFS